MGNGTALLVAILLPIPLSPFPSVPFPKLPPLAHTGGFGEPTCHTCHFGNPLNDPDGRLTVTGLPDRFAGDSTYLLTVQLVRAGMAAAGFELAVRNASGADSGRQSGRLEPVDGRTDVSDSSHAAFGRVQYARHTIFGSNLTGPDSARWTMKWKAPPGSAGALVLHVVANAGNDDASPLDDFIYSASTRTLPIR